VITRVPTARLVVAGLVATPLPSNVTGVPRFAPSTLNWAVPAGVPDPLVTVAVNVTLWPNTDGFPDDDTVVVVGIGFTTWPPSRVPTLVAKFASFDV
jgi:hypothetical protein